jgi:mucin-19
MAITVKHKFVSAIPDAGDPNIVQPSNWNDDHELTGTIPVSNGGTGASTLTGYVKGNGTAAMTASATVPSTDITGLGTMSTQNSSNINVTGGSISGTTVAGYVPTTTTITAGTGLSGGGDLSANRTLSISNTTVTAAAYGSASKTLTATVNAQGQLTALADTNIAITNTQVSGLGTASTKDAGAALGVATLDAGGKVPVSELPAAVLGALSYQGTWDASTNTPTLTSSVGTKGYYYVVSVAGSTNLNGITDWLVGDWAVFNGTVWQKVDNTDAVTSVNGLTGAVVLTASSVGAVPTTRTISTGTGLTGGGDLSADRTIAIDSTVATLTGTQTLTNKTLTSPKVNEILDANGNEVLGLLSTASATDYLAIKNGIGVGVPLHISSEGSSANIGLHIQPKGTGLVTISDGTDFNKGIRFRSSGSAASAITLLDAVSSAGHVITLPDATTTLVGRGTTDTITNKSISGTTNTLTDIGNASLTNSTITINGNSTALGGSVSVGTVTSVAATAGTGISVSGSPITGSGTLTITNTAPDQTVAIASGTGISVSGTYPNFTVTNTAPSSGGTVTSVTGTSPVVSSGGATPAISLAANYGDTQNPYDSKTANFVLAAPNGSAGAPTFRAIAAADIPTLNQNTTGTASNVTGTVAIANGGTGETTRQAAMDTLAGAVTSGQYLRGNGTDVVMSAIQAADVPTLNQNTTGTASNVTGTVAIANGGTGQTTAAAAFNALNPMTTTGDIIYEASATTAARLPIGTSGQVLTVASGIPSWATPSAGGGLSWQTVKTSAFTAVASQAFPVNTTSASITATLPATPSAGDTVLFVDYAGTWDTNALIIGRNGSKIQGTDNDYRASRERESVTLTYIDSTQGWIVTNDGYMGTAPIALNTFSADLLVVAGGGGGGFDTGGGGAAGGFRTATTSLGYGTSYTLTVGSGGASNTKGNDSSISGTGLTTITSTGGGQGGAQGSNGGNGGSGGGSGYGSATAGTGNTPSTSPSQGNNGGTGFNSGGNYFAGGGGGGASAVGTNAFLSGVTTNGGNGGNGSASSITGTSVTYAGGGGGTGYSLANSVVVGTGGTGGGGAGGGNSTNGTNGTANLGGGGGCSGYLTSTGAQGGSGVVIVKYPDTITVTNSGGGLTFSTASAGGFKVTTFTAGTGNIQFN